MKCFKLCVVIFVASLGLVSSIFGVAKYYGNPFKSDDPSNPSFSVYNFRFEKYRSKDDIQRVFGSIFPPGTPKRLVDGVLVEAAGATFKWNKNNPSNLESKIGHYYYSSIFYSLTPVNHVFIFNANDEVVNIRPLGGPLIF